MRGTVAGPFLQPSGGVMYQLTSALACVIAVATASPAAGKPLSDVLVIIDPGHGGLDDGASGRVNGQRVVEDEHVYDVALRLRDYVRAVGGTPVLTISDPKQRHPIDNPPGQFLPDDQREVVRGGGCRLTSGSRCLRARIAAGRTAVRQWHRRAVWISIHFDVVPNDNVVGVRVIGSPEGPMRAAEAILAAFAENPDRTRKRAGADGAPLVRSGDRTHGLRRLFILGRRNPFANKMLIELGNFRNDADLWRIRDPHVREEYAQRIARGLSRWANPPRRPVARRPAQARVAVSR